MDKKIAQAVLERSEGLCENCGGNYMVQLHHRIGGKGKRVECETEQSVIALCWYCHHGDYGIHGRFGRELDLKLKKELEQKYIDLGYSEEKIYKLLGGRFYL